jgi:hypothetical protein
MGFSSENGYTAPTVQEIMTDIMGEINTQFGTSYTYETFVGTNFYKYFYALAQRVQENEIKTAEIFLKLQQYFDVTNESIQRPVATNPGIIEALSREGYTASVKPMVDIEAGELSICVDVDDTDPEYSATQLDICTIIKDSIAAGIVTNGTETENIVLTNGQDFDFSYFLPNRIPILLKLTLTLSENNQELILSPEEVKEILIANIESKYHLGKNFEPQTYFTILNAPWCSQVLLEWSDDAGASWESAVFDAEFDDLFDYALEDITVVEA